jgi:hypothetical protein
LRGGRFVFDLANEGLLAGLMPSFVHIANDDTFLLACSQFAELELVGVVATECRQ